MAEQSYQQDVGFIDGATPEQRLQRDTRDEVKFVVCLGFGCVVYILLTTYVFLSVFHD